MLVLGIPAPLWIAATIGLAVLVARATSRFFAKPDDAGASWTSKNAAPLAVAALGLLIAVGSRAVKAEHVRPVVLVSGSALALFALAVRVGVGLRRPSRPLPEGHAEEARDLARKHTAAWSPWRTLGKALSLPFADLVHGLLPLLIATILASLAPTFVGVAARALIRMPPPNPDAATPAPGIEPNQVLLGLGALTALTLISFFGIGGGLNVALKLVRGERPRIWDAFSGARVVFPMLGLTIVVGLASLLGIVALVVPFVLLQVGWWLAVPLIVDRNLGVFEAIEESWRATRGSRLRVLGLLVLLQALQLTPVGLQIALAKGPAGLQAACALLSLLTVPVAWVAWAHAYESIRKAPRVPQSSGVSLTIGYAVIGFVYGGVFLALVRVANALPVTRGSHVVMKHEAIRASALLTGVVFLIVVLGALLPMLLDGLERAGFSRFVGARHVRSSKSGFLTVISLLAILGVSMSSCALGSVISIMGGFGADLKRKILANNAHIVVDAPAPKGFSEWEPVLERVRKVPGVEAATPVITSEVMAAVDNNTSGVLLRGIEVDEIGKVIDLPKNMEEHLGKLEWLKEPELVANLPWSERRGVDTDDDFFRPDDTPTPPPPKKPPPTFGEKHEPNDPLIEKIGRALPPPPSDRPIYPCVVIGRELAKTLHLRIGSEVSLVSRMGELSPAGVVPRERKFRVAGIFFSGMYEYDATHAYVTMEAARDFLDQPDRINAIQVKVSDVEAADKFRPAIESAVGREELRTRDWREINKNLFSALKLERIATFIVLSLAIIVASFCILCTLLLMVTEKGAEIAILKALGASDGAILRIFMVEGMIIGGIGTVFGVATGYAICFGLSWFGVRIDPDVYYIDRLPIAVNAWDFAAVTAAALVICAVSTLYPARAASKLLPVDGLRYE
jgi:lipoprotein-releasing system permease protein